jgi:hypothetical protein
LLRPSVNPIFAQYAASGPTSGVESSTHRLSPRWWILTITSESGPGTGSRQSPAPCGGADGLADGSGVAEGSGLGVGFAGPAKTGVGVGFGFGLTAVLGPGVGAGGSVGV